MLPDRPDKVTFANRRVALKARTMSTQKSFKTSLYDYFKSYNPETSVTLVSFMETYHNRLQTPTTMEIYMNTRKNLMTQ